MLVLNRLSSGMSHSHTFFFLWATDDIGTQEVDQMTDSLTEQSDSREMGDPEISKHDHMVVGEDMVILDDTSEGGKEDTLDDDRRISTTSDDVLAGIGGEGAELHPEYDDFDDDDQQFEVLETADGDLSGEQRETEPSTDTSSTKKERGRDRESGKKEKPSSEKSGTICTRTCTCR